MCKRFCGLFFNDEQKDCCSLALAPSVIVFCVIQIAIAVVGSFVMAEDDWLIWGMFTFVTVCDAMTGIWAACSANALLAFCALIGFFVDFFAHSALVVYWYYRLARSSFGRTNNVLRIIWELILSLIRSFVILSLSYFMLRVVYSYYRVVQLGGNGWERKSPKDLKDEYHGQGSGFFEQLDATEAARLLDPEATYYQF